MRKAQCPLSPRGKRGRFLWYIRSSPGHTTLPKKKDSTRFCIRIYYLKDSLKIKILYSVVKSFFLLSVNKMVLRKHDLMVADAQDHFSPQGRSAKPSRPGPESSPQHAAFFRHDLLGKGKRRLVCDCGIGNVRAVPQMSQAHTRAMSTSSVPALCAFHH